MKLEIWENLWPVRTLCDSSEDDDESQYFIEVWGWFQGILKRIMSLIPVFSVPLPFLEEWASDFPTTVHVSNMMLIHNDVVCLYVLATIWKSGFHNIFFLSFLLLSQWCTVQHCPLQKMAFSSKTYVITTSMRPVVHDACQILTSRVPASDCARLTAPGRGPPPAA